MITVQSSYTRILLSNLHNRSSKAYTIHHKQKPGKNKVDIHQVTDVYGSTHHVCMCVCGGGGGGGWLCCHKAVAWHRDQTRDCDMCSQDSVFGDSGRLRELC